MMEFSHMPGSEISNKKQFEINFGGDLHEIDAELLIESLVSYSNVAQETSAFLSPKSRVNIKIQAPQRGSFTIILNLIAEGAESLFNIDNLNAAATIVGLVADLYSFRKWIAKKGKPEKVEQVDDNSVRIENKNGDITIDNRVYNIYTSSPKTRENLRNTFSRLKDSKEITDFTMKDETGDIFKAEKSDFEELSSDKDETEQKKQIVLKKNQELSLFKVVFQENYKWEFFYQGNKIYASLKDKDFFSKIEKGEIAFKSGDRLRADMEICQVFHEAANTFVNDSYSLVKVLEHIPREPIIQTSLDDELNQ